MKVFSNWRSVRLWETQVERDLHRRHALRVHGLAIGTLTLLVMWAASALLMWAGVDALALRYAVALGLGYLAYLGILRWWAQRLVRDEDDRSSGWGDGIDLPGELPLPRPPSGGGQAPASSFRSGGGGDYAGGGSSGDFAAPGADAGGTGLGELAGDALGAAAGADEGAVVVVPVVAVFLIGAAVLFGAGALVLVYFGSEALLAVAIEIAFSYASARTAVRVAREGWLGAAVRLTWKPLLGALACAVVLGIALDRFMPQAGSLPQAVRLLTGRG